MQQALHEIGVRTGKHHRTRDLHGRPFVQHGSVGSCGASGAEKLRVIARHGVRASVPAAWLSLAIGFDYLGVKRRRDLSVVYEVILPSNILLPGCVLLMNGKLFGYLEESSH